MQTSDQRELPVSNSTDQNPRRKSWWGRNWFWVVPVGCLTPILACGGLVTLILTIVFGAMKASHPYQDSLATLQNDQRVVAVLGSPIDAGLLVTGQINLNGSSGIADISYSVSGPQDSADVYVSAVKNAGQWTYTNFVVVPDSTGQGIDMLSSP